MYFFVIYSELTYKDKRGDQVHNLVSLMRDHHQQHCSPCLLFQPAEGSCMCACEFEPQGHNMLLDRTTSQSILSSYHHLVKYYSKIRI